VNSEPTAQQALVAAAASSLLDPQGRALAAQVQWWSLPELGAEGPWPVAVLGEGPPVLLLHGFDSSFLEFRRLAPLLASGVQLFIPDLYGFGFCPTAAITAPGACCATWRFWRGKLAAAIPPPSA
jgi:pimeloyl-ACP methyl ester carboxylesterase